MAGFLSVLLLSFSLLACSDRPPGLTLPQTPVLATDTPHALVIVEITRLQDRPDGGGAIAAHARRGDVVPVLGRNANESWIEVQGPFGHGWVIREDVELYRSRRQAINARQHMRLPGDAPQ